MKARYYFLLLIAASSVLGACSRDEENFFDQTASERAQAALDNADNVFTGAKNGWEMLYFANPESRGYNVLVTFDENGKVTATAKNSAVTGNRILTDSSTWEVKNDYGPILTFDTYNKVLHAWADPGTDGDGLLGDYEFLILHVDSSYAKLKGKKHSAYAYLYPFDDTEYADYFAEVEALRAKLFDNSNLLEWSDGKNRYHLYAGNTGIFELTPYGEVPNEEELDIYPFAENRTGIQLTFPVLDNKDVYYTFTDGKLVSETATIVSGEVHSYVKNYITLVGGGWNINLTDLSDIVKTALTTADDAIKTAYNNKKKGGTTAMRMLQKDDAVVLAYSYIGSGSKASTYYYTFNLEVVDGKVRLAYDKPYDENAQKVLAAIPSIETLFNSLNGEYLSVAAEPINPTLGIKLTDNTNPELWLDITGSVN